MKYPSEKPSQGRPTRPSSVQSSALSIDDPSIARLIVEYQAELICGRQPDRSRILAQFPEIAGELNECIDGLEFVNRATQQDAPFSGEEAPTPFSAAQPVGDFLVVRELGRGGMGVVYEAEQLSLGRRVALKILPFAAMLDTRRLERFRNEARAAARLKHENIVSVYSIGCDRGVHYYAMELVEGYTLTEIIEMMRGHYLDSAAGIGVGSSAAARPSDDTSPIAQLSTACSSDSHCRSVARLGIQIADALHYAHEQKIVHRDIKPSNILVDQVGKPWITDFGLAHIQGDQNLTMTGDILGTLRYMSPEQAEGSGALDGRSDVYSLGLVLYELLTTKPAHGECNVNKLHHQIVEVDPPSPRRWNHAISKDLATIVLTAISRRAEDRYQTAAALAADLKLFLEHRPIRARRTTRMQHVLRWTKRNPIVAALAASLLLLMSFLSIAGPLVAIRQHRLMMNERELSATTRLQDYVLSVAQAYHDWGQGISQRTSVALERCIPSAGQRDLRGFEWHHLYNRSQRTLDIPSVVSPAPINDTAFSPNGQTIATACIDGVVRVWDTDSLELVKEFSGHEGEVKTVAYSNDGRWIASGGGDGKVLIWDVQNETIHAVLQKYPVQVKCVEFSSNGHVLFSGNDDGKLIAWDIRDPNNPQPTTIDASGHGLIFALAISPNEKLLASGGGDGMVKIWSLPSLELVTTLPIHSEIAMSIAFSPDGRLMAVGGWRDITLWDTSKWIRIERWDTENRSVNSVDFTPDGHVLIAPFYSRLAAWDVTSKERLGSIFDFGDMWHIELSPDGRRIAGIGESLAFYPNDVRPRRQETAASFRASIRVASIAHGSKNWLVVGLGHIGSLTESGSISVYDLDSLERKYELEELPSILAMAQDPTRPNRIALAGGRVGGGDSPAEVILLDLINGNVVRRLTTSHSGQCLALAYSPCGRWIASSVTTTLYDELPGVIDIWDVNTCELIHTFPGFTAMHLAFTSDGRRLLAGGGSWPTGEMRVYDMRRRAELSRRQEYQRMVMSFALSSSERQVAVVDYGGGFQIENFDGQALSPLHFQTGGFHLRNVCYSPDGMTVAVGGQNGQVTMWSAETGDSLGTLFAHSEVTSLCFSGDGQMLIAGCSDHSVVLWRRDGRREVIPIE